MDYDFLIAFFIWIVIGYLVVFRVTIHSPAVGLTIMRIAGRTNKAVYNTYMVTKVLAVLIWPFSGWITLLGTKIGLYFAVKVKCK